MDSSFNLAVHALVCLSHSGRSLSSEALAENICTNPTRVRRVLAGLKKVGMVETREGLDGGYRLTADPASLTLRQVAEAVNTRFVDCAWHSGDIDRDCAICSGMAGVGRFVVGLLDDIRIIDSPELTDYLRNYLRQHALR